MKITKADDGSFDVKITTRESKALLTIFIHGLVGAGELTFNAETKEYEPSDTLKQLLGEVVNG